MGEVYARQSQIQQAEVSSHQSDNIEALQCHLTKKKTKTKAKADMEFVTSGNLIGVKDLTNSMSAPRDA